MSKKLMHIDIDATSCGTSIHPWSSFCHIYIYTFWRFTRHSRLCLLCSARKSRRCRAFFWGGSKWGPFFRCSEFPCGGGSFWPPGIFNVPMNLALFVGITLLACMAKRQLEHHERHSMLQLISERRWVTLRLGSECVVV